MRLAVVGKGGAGKSVITGTLARLLARRGCRVLALDSDMQPGLALTLGAHVPPDPPLLDAVEKDENGRWRLKQGSDRLGPSGVTPPRLPTACGSCRRGRRRRRGSAP